VILHAAGDLDVDGALEPTMAAEFRNYLVVQTPETLRRFQETVAPGVALTDQAAAERIAARWQLRTVPEQAPAYANPTLILAGRQDATVGYAGVWRLLEHYPRATFAHSTWGKRLGAGTRRPAWLLRAQLAPAGYRPAPVRSST
jgi:hypothetical protein